MSIPQRPGRKPGTGPTRKAPPPPVPSSPPPTPPPSSYPGPPSSESASFPGPPSTPSPPPPSTPSPTNPPSVPPSPPALPSSPPALPTSCPPSPNSSSANASADWAAQLPPYSLAPAIPQRGTQRKSRLLSEGLDPRGSTTDALALATQSPESESALKLALDTIGAQSWKNEAWTRNRSRRAPQRKSPDVVNLADVVENMAAYAPSSFCAQNLQLHSTSLSQDWLESTSARLYHILAVLNLLHTGEFKCTCAFLFESKMNENQMAPFAEVRRQYTNPPKGTIPSAGDLEATECLPLFLHAFLGAEGPSNCFWLVTDLLNYEKRLVDAGKDSPALRRSVELALEYLVKIFWVLQRICKNQGALAAKGAILAGSCRAIRFSVASWLIKDRVRWWLKGGVDEVFLAMAPFGAPERVSTTLVDLLMDHLSLVSDQSYTSFHSKKVIDLKLLPVLTIACLISKFDFLEGILRYLTFLVVQRPENARIFISADRLLFIMPTLLTAGTSFTLNKQLRDKDAKLADEKVGNIVRNAVGLIMSIIHNYFMDVNQPVSIEPPPSSSSSFTSSFSSSSPSSAASSSPTLCSVMFSIFDALEDTSHRWDADTVLRANVICMSLLIKLNRSLKTFKNDSKSLIWESLFQLAFAIEDLVWYSMPSATPRTAPRHFKSFDPRGNTGATMVLTQFDDFLALLEPSVRDDDVPRLPEEKKRIDLLRGRLSEERDFIAASLELIKICNVMDSNTLMMDRRYRAVANTSKLRLSHYGDPTISNKLLAPLGIKSPTVRASKIERSATLKSDASKSLVIPRKGTMELPKTFRRALTPDETELRASLQERKSISEKGVIPKRMSRSTSSLEEVQRRKMSESATPPLPPEIQQNENQDARNWKRYADPDGLPVYYNIVTRVLQSEKPACLLLLESQEPQEPQEPPTPSSVSTTSSSVTPEPPLQEDISLHNPSSTTSESGLWEEFKDPEGEAFFFNAQQEHATYEQPPSDSSVSGADFVAWAADANKADH